jgi:endonuclease YncB( thermonuclease family)
MRANKLLVCLITLLVTNLVFAATVDRVIDGDTVVLDNDERVRLIGVDAPEVGQPGAERARAFLEGMTAADEVELQYDSDYSGDRKDTHGRTLAYLHLPNGICINAELIRRGYCKVLRDFPFSRKGQFINYEKEAQERHLGIWAKTKGGLSIDYFPGRCIAITKNGTRCKRRAMPGSDYCWQHQNYRQK